MSFNLPREAIDEYQQIYFELHGEKISAQKATSGANKLIRLISTIQKPVLDKNENEKLHQNSK